MPVLTRIGTNSINDNAVTTVKIGNDQVTAAKIPAGAVVADVGAGGITATQLATDAVTTVKIANDAITGAKLADDAITGAKLANDIAISSTGNIATTGSGTITSAGNLTVDTIVEKTSAAGVSIDGFNIKDSSLATATNKYPFLKSSEIGGSGVPSHNWLGSAFYVSTLGAAEWNHGSWMEVAKQSVTAIVWSKIPTSGATGSDDADKFSLFIDGSNQGRFKPTISGYYFVTYCTGLGSLANTNWAKAQIRINGSSSHNYAYTATKASSTQPCWMTASGTVALDTDDYCSLWIVQDSGTAKTLQTTSIAFTYLGTSDL